jgi:hypothetical protein
MHNTNELVRANRGDFFIVVLKFLGPKTQFCEGLMETVHSGLPPF